MQEWKMREHIAGVENAWVENSGVDHRSGKCRSGKYRSDKVWKAIRRRKYSKVTRRNISFHAGLSESYSDADDDDDTDAPDDNTQHQNDDDTSDDAGTPTTVSADAATCRPLWGVSRGTAWYTHRAGAMRSSTLLWVVCQRSAQPRTRLSSLPHAYQYVAASVLTWLTPELVFENNITRSINKK